MGANSTFIGTNIDASGITIGSTVNWTGRALAFGGTVSTDTDTMTAPVCANTVSATATAVPGLPNTAAGTSTNHLQWVAVLALLTTALAAVYLVHKRV